MGLFGQVAVLLVLSLLFFPAQRSLAVGYVVPGLFFSDPSSVEDALDNIPWLNRMAIKAQLDSFIPSKLPQGVRYPCPKDEALLVKMGLGSPEFQTMVTSSQSGDELVAKLKLRLGAAAYRGLKQSSFSSHTPVTGAALVVVSSHSASETPHSVSVSVPTVPRFRELDHAKHSDRKSTGLRERKGDRSRVILSSHFKTSEVQNLDAGRVSESAVHAHTAQDSRVGSECWPRAS